MFLEGEQGLGLLLPARQLTILLLEFLELGIHPLPLPAPLLRRQPVLALAAPCREQRGVEPLFPQERAELTGAVARIRLPEDLQFLGRREPSSGWASGHFGIGWGGRRLAHDRGRPSATGRLASLVVPPLRLSHDRLSYQQAAGRIHQ